MADPSSAVKHPKARGDNSTLPQLGKASACAERGPGVWDVIPLRDLAHDRFEDALLRMKVDSFFECLALCIHFILKEDITFAQVEGELWGRHHDIEALGSAILGRRLAGVIYDVEVAFKVLADRRASLERDAQKLFERWIREGGEAIPRRQLRANAFAVVGGRCTELERYIRSLAEHL